MSELIDYYLDKCPEIWSKSDHYFEGCHDFVQWMFPLKEPSNFNPDAPLLTEEDILLFKSNPKLKENLKLSFLRFMKFIGLEYEPPKFNELDNFNEEIFYVANHNWLRFTRIIKSLTILGLREEAKHFYSYLVLRQYGSNNSRQYWRDALGEPIITYED
jgi:Opioid growth factor receptor (OGFr) conserved region